MALYQTSLLVRECLHSDLKANLRRDVFNDRMHGVQARGQLQWLTLETFQFWAYAHQF